jgi:hypothetical protein
MATTPRSMSFRRLDRQDLIDRDPAAYLQIMAAIFNGAEVQERR